MKLAVLLGAVAFAYTAALTPANALTPVGQSYTFTFTGSCAANDCSGSGTGSLTVQNYTLGDELNPSNLVSFSYSSNLIPAFEISGSDPSESLLGSITTAPGMYSIDVHKFVGGLYSDFSSSTSGTWNVINNEVASDTGTDGIWNSASAVSAAPEPGAWALLLGGIGILGAMMRVANARRREDELKSIATA